MAIESEERGSEMDKVTNVKEINEASAFLRPDCSNSLKISPGVNKPAMNYTVTKLNVWPHKEKNGSYNYIAFKSIQEQIFDCDFFLLPG